MLGVRGDGDPKGCLELRVVEAGEGQPSRDCLKLGVGISLAGFFNLVQAFEFAVVGAFELHGQPGRAGLCGLAQAYGGNAAVCIDLIPRAGQGLVDGRQRDARHCKPFAVQMDTIGSGAQVQVDRDIARKARFVGDDLQVQVVRGGYDGRAQ